MITQTWVCNLSSICECVYSYTIQAKSMNSGLTFYINTPKKFLQVFQKPVISAHTQNTNSVFHFPLILLVEVIEAQICSRVGSSKI